MQDVVISTHVSKNMCRRENVGVLGLSSATNNTKGVQLRLDISMGDEWTHAYLSLGGFRFIWVNCNDFEDAMG